MSLERVPVTMNSDVPREVNDSATIYSIADFHSQSKRLPRSPFAIKWSVAAVGPTPTPTQLFVPVLGAWDDRERDADVLIRECGAAPAALCQLIHVSDLTRAENFQ
jgi:hypothetical protein